MNTPKGGASADGTCSNDAAATPSGDGLGLLLYASHASSMPNKLRGDSEVPFSFTSVSSKQSGSNYVKNDSSSSELDDVKNNHQLPADDALKHSHLSKTFPQILHEILSTPEYEAIIHWLPDGSSFIIADRHRFADEILPKHFQNETLFHSFVRKLNRWGFYRVNGGCKEKDGSLLIWYSHSCFLRDHPELCLNIRCKSRSKQSPMRVLPPVKRMKQQAAAAEVANRIAQKSLQAAANEAICAAKKTEATPRSTFTKKEQKAAATEEANSNTAMAVRMNAATTSVLTSSLGVERSGLYARRVSFGSGSTPTLSTTAFAPKSIVSPLTLPVAAATVPDSIASVGTATVNTRQDLQFLSSMPPSHLELLLQERERLISKMDQRRKLQMELQRLNDMSVQFLQSPIMRQYEYMLQKGALSRED